MQVDSEILKQRAELAARQCNTTYLSLEIKITVNREGVAKLVCVAYTPLAKHTRECDSPQEALDLLTGASAEPQVLRARAAELEQEAASLRHAANSQRTPKPKRDSAADTCAV